MCTVKDSSLIDDYIMPSSSDDGDMNDHIMNSSEIDRLEISKYLFDRYLLREQPSDSMSKSTSTKTTIANESISTEINDNGNSEVMNELKKLNLAIKQVQQAVDSIPSKIEEALRSFQQSQMQNKDMCAVHNNESNNDDKTTIISDDIEILDHFTDTQSKNFANEEKINCDQKFIDNNLQSSSNSKIDYYQTEFYQNWSQNYNRQISASKTSLPLSITSNKMFQLSTIGCKDNTSVIERSWLYHVDHPKPRINQSIIPYCRELDLDVWLVK